MDIVSPSPAAGEAKDQKIDLIGEAAAAGVAQAARRAPMVMPTSVVDTKYAFCARVENPLASAAPSTLVPTYRDRSR
jgi:hypothetical protein